MPAADVTHFTVALDGYTDLPPGLLANVVTYLEMTERPEFPAIDCPLQRLGDDLDAYLRLYRRIGESWLWFSRLETPHDELRALFARPDYEAFALLDAGQPVGLFELDFREAPDCEIKYFGLVPERVGAGFGRALMEEALRRAWARPIARVFLHTCTLDHPGAVGFYRRAGFKAYKRAVELHPDPRLLGLLPRAAAPDVPLLDPG